jgi:hypothetical protein
MEGLEEGFQPSHDGEAVMVALEGRALAVFPCKTDKAPLTPHGFKDATDDPAVIEVWSRKFPLWAAPTGEHNGFDVLDIDPGGQNWLINYECTWGPLPATRIVATRRGGLHYFFKHRVGIVNSESMIAPEVDIRGEGGYVIWWPVHGCRVLSDAPIAPWPEPMLMLLRESTERSGADWGETPLSKSAPFRSEDQPTLPKTTRNLGTRTSRIMTVLYNAGPGDRRNKKLYWAARRFGQLIAEGSMTREIAEEMLLGPRVITATSLSMARRRLGTQ